MNVSQSKYEILWISWYVNMICVQNIFSFLFIN